MVAHYTQQPIFPELFKRLSHSPALKKIHDELNKKQLGRIYKQDWCTRAEFETEIGAENLLYMLADTSAKHLYIGETQNLIRRLKLGHPIIKNWTHYRYDVLPDLMVPFRGQLERMMIRAYTATFANSKKISSLEIPGYKLVNEKIDK